MRGPLIRGTCVPRIGRQGLRLTLCMTEVIYVPLSKFVGKSVLSPQNRLGNLRQLSFIITYYWNITYQICKQAIKKQCHVNWNKRSSNESIQQTNQITHYLKHKMDKMKSIALALNFKIIQQTSKKQHVYLQILQQTQAV